MPRKRSRKSIVAEAAKRWHIPFWIMWGVYGIETDWGKNKATSSAGAQGDFQFIPGTAATYHVNVGSLESSANGAAHYLHDLRKSTGSWDAALHGYSGGGYGLTDVRAKAREGGAKPGQTAASVLGAGGAHTVFAGQKLAPIQPGPGGLGGFPGGLIPQIPGVPDVGGQLLDFPSEIVGAAKAFTGFIQTILSVDLWIRVGEVVAALVLVFFGLKALTGGESGGVARSARRIRRATPAGRAASYARHPIKAAEGRPA